MNPVTQALINQGEIIMNGKAGDPKEYANGCNSPQPAAKKRYVRHISGQGKKWELADSLARNDNSPGWMVRTDDGACYLLPKSEYTLVPPVKRWVDVTKDCREANGDILHTINGLDHSVISTRGLASVGYRFRFIVKPIVKGGMLEDAAFLVIEHEEEVPDGV